MVKKIAVIGAGINGISCAVQLQQKFKGAVEVVVISEDFSPNTTGDGSAGLWGPYLMGNTPNDKVYKWSKSMHDFLKEIWLSDKAGEAGVCLLPAIRVTLQDGNIWENVVYGCKPLTQKQLDSLNEGRVNKFTRGHFFTTFTSEPLKFIPFLTKMFLVNGGKFIKRRIQNLNEFSTFCDYDIIVNCTGLGSKVICGDTTMQAIRGQVSRVKADWIYCAFLDEADEGNYIIPNTESVVLGGTHQINDFNTSVYPEDSEFIYKGCRDVLPGLKNVPTLFQWVGLRPGRPQVRLEPEVLPNGKVIIHNYGHGGCGVTVAWGCAEDVVELVKTQFSKL